MNDAWLVIIDMQTIFTRRQWWPCPKFKEIIGPVEQLAAAFGERVLLTRFVDGPAVGSWRPYYDESPFARVPPSHPRYNIVKPLRYLATADNVVTATTFSKWDGLRLKTGEHPHLVLTGVATDCCVLSTAMSAAESGAFVTVVMDACAGSSDDNQTAAYNILQGYKPLISTTTTAELLASRRDEQSLTARRSRT